MLHKKNAEIDTITTLTSVPVEAREYRLGN